MGKRPALVCADPVPEELSFVPGTDLISPNVIEAYDLVIFLDCSELGRCAWGSPAPSLDTHPTISIDHHVTNRGFATVDLVDATAASTAQVVLRLLDTMGAPVDAQAATCLLTGIVTDTRGFRTSNVTVETLEAGVRLMKAGAPLTTITQEALDRQSIPALRLWGAALDGAQVEDRVIWAVIPLQVSRRAGVAAGDDAGLASYLIGARDTDGAAVFVEQKDGTIEVGLRAAPGFDVSQLAQCFGGGGHALAAGCSQPGPLGDVVGRVLAAMKRELAQQRDSHGQRDTESRQAPRPDVA